MDQIVTKHNWVRVTEKDVQRYAEITQDFNPLHLDADFAGQTIFGGSIIHGTLGVRVLLDTLESVCGNGPLEIDMRYSKPVPVGSAVRLVLGGETKDNRTSFSIEREDGQHAVVGSFKQVER